MRSSPSSSSLDIENVRISTRRSSRLNSSTDSASNGTEEARKLDSSAGDLFRASRGKGPPRFSPKREASSINSSPKLLSEFQRELLLEQMENDASDGIRSDLHGLNTGLLGAFVIFLPARFCQAVSCKVLRNALDLTTSTLDQYAPLGFLCHYPQRSAPGLGATADR